ncbi:hypothetical protein BDB00DRAFT_861574 [Zychaea mexicana]|uniref:uncharacterized protein n=1 Tax=Zychaea mexicana TaxID=64656 RepID=UPI0022FDF656|nr:uncharacterized protein BDB00DRAFT_861574 [Zychaea mexicana]KAI9472880.1 hypothetical protein BDB00DRAFT_861574 [Zychaea mexicana]
MPAQAIPELLDIPSFKHLTLYTGNVMRTSVAGRSKALSKKSNTELITAIDDTLYASLDRDEPSFRYHEQESLLEVPDLRSRSRILPEDRNDVEVTAKLFYLGQQQNNNNVASYIRSGVQHLQKVLGVDAIDTFIVSFGGRSESITPAWQQLEVLHQRNHTLGKLGVADFSQEQLESILSNPAVTVKPSINQINVGQCCNMPSAMIELAKQHNIELLHNGDRADILDIESLSALLRKHNVHATVAPQFVIKYHVFVKCRSVVSDKGYIVVGDTLA